MLTLHKSGVKFENFQEESVSEVIRLTDDPKRPKALSSSEAFICRDGKVSPNSSCYILFDSTSNDIDDLPEEARKVILPDEFRYLSHGDVVRFQPNRNRIHVLYRRNANTNSFLVTERCNHYCLMCSQPPRNIQDDWILSEIIEVLPLIDQNTGEIGFTGGEPTLLGDEFIAVLRAASKWLPRTAIHVLSNGRRFSEIDFAEKWSQIGHFDLMVGIPIYSDISSIHNYIVQADHAFDETIRGILNLKRLGQKVEVRVVIHQQNYDRLPELADFIVRNLTFIDHVALMGLEMIGFARANLDVLWVDPIDYKDHLYLAATRLSQAGINVSIYNHQLCLIDSRLEPLARRSISDWKNEYMSECEPCTRKNECGGFFSSAQYRYSSHITPFLEA